MEILWSLSDKRQQLLAALFSFLLVTHIKDLAKTARDTSKFRKTSCLQFCSLRIMKKHEWERNLQLYVSKTFSLHLKGISSLKNTERSESKMFIEKNLWCFSSSHINITAASFLEAAFACSKDYQSIRDKKEMSKTVLAAAFVSDASCDTIMSSARDMTLNIL